MTVLKRAAAHLPQRWQAELKRLHFARQIARDRFETHEAEFARLHELIAPGDWVIDVGANIGQYTKRMSDLVGPDGRVLAFEPVPDTFTLLAANVNQFRHANVTLFNAAVSARVEVLGMAMPRFDTGLTNYYMAHLVNAAEAELKVLTMPLDALPIERRVSLIKIDAEGHEAVVLQGMRALLERSRPAMIIETGSAELVATLEGMGYRVERAPKSSNVLCRPVA